MVELAVSAGTPGTLINNRGNVASVQILKKQPA